MSPDRVARIRGLTGMTLDAMGAELGVSKYTVRSWELPESSHRHRPIGKLAADRLLQMEREIVNRRQLDGTVGGI